MKIGTNLQIIKGKYYYVPLVDVVFILLIFFLLSSSFVQVSAINIKLPTAPAQFTSVEKLVVTIDNNSNYYFNDQVMDFKTLKKQLALIVSKYQIDSIIIRADKDTPHGTVSNMLTLASNLNLNVYFAVAAQPEQPHIAIEN